jgi:hypothetical protein
MFARRHGDTPESADIAAHAPTFLPVCRLYKQEALSGTRTLDPLLTIQVAKEEEEGTDDPSSPSDPGDSGA